MADPTNDADADEAPAGGGKMKLIMLGGGALVLLAVGIFAGPAIQNMISPPDEETRKNRKRSTPPGRNCTSRSILP